MSATVALRHQARPVTDSRQWRGSRLADSARLSAPELRHRARKADDLGPGVEVDPHVGDANPLATAMRLWLGVLSIFALIVVLGLLLIVLGSWAFGFRPVVVTSGSMSPTIRTGDIVITRPVGMEDEVGDQTVIDFEDPATAERRLHRVIEVAPDGYRTKGDANDSADPQLVPQDHVDGAGFMLAPYLGYLPLWIDQRAWAPLGAFAIAAVALTTMASKRWMWKGATR